jgi:glutathione peroxidase
MFAGAAVSPALAQAPAMNRVTAFAFSFAALDGGTIRLADHAGKPIMVVNTASLCGYTPQYTGLQEVWTRFKDRGLLLVGVPSNDFGGQEPGGATEIDETAHHLVRRHLPDHRQGRRQRPRRAPVLQMGSGRAAGRHAALELS